MPRPTLRLIATLVGVALTVSACGESAAPATSAAAALHAGSVTIDDTATTAGDTSTLSGYVATESASVTWSDSSAGSASIVLVDGTIYVDGAKAIEAAATGLPTRVLPGSSGPAIAIHRGDTPYRHLAELVSLSGELSVFTATAHRRTTHLANPTTPTRDVVAGTIDLGAGWTAVASLTSDQMTGLPTSGLVEATHGRTVLTRTARFTAWGKRSTVAAPSTSVPYAELAS